MTGQDHSDWYLAIPDFEKLGDPTATYRGRFVGNGSAGEVAGDDFLFSPCPEWLINEIEPSIFGPVVVLSLPDTGASRAGVADATHRQEPSAHNRDGA